MREIFSFSKQLLLNLRLVVVHETTSPFPASARSRISCARMDRNNCIEMVRKTRGLKLNATSESDFHFGAGDPKISTVSGPVIFDIDDRGRKPPVFP